MLKVIKALKAGFESSCGLTKEFADFFRLFKKEFTKELESVGATDIQFSRGHFYISGFYTIGTQVWYFNLCDVRGTPMGLKLMYRTAKNYSDYTGGTNRWVAINVGMAKEMHTPVVNH